MSKEEVVASFMHVFLSFNHQLCCVLLTDLRVDIFRVTRSKSNSAHSVVL